MTPDDPIYRFAGNWRGRVSFLCAGCSKHWLQPDRWTARYPCERCGRTVGYDDNRVVPKHAVCSDQCRIAVYRAISIARRRLLVERRRCKVCQAWFMPKRSDARYCKAACKQKAYRQAPGKPA